MQQKQGVTEQHSNGSVCSSVGAGELTSKELDGVGDLRPVGEGLRLMPPRLDPAISNRREWRPPLLDRAIKGDRDEASASERESQCR